MPKDTSTLEGPTTDFNTGAPYVMFEGTDYAHLMIPTEVIMITKILFLQFLILKIIMLNLTLHIPQQSGKYGRTVLLLHPLLLLTVQLWIWMQMEIKLF